MAHQIFVTHLFSQALAIMRVITYLLVDDGLHCTIIAAYDDRTTNDQRPSR